MEMITGKGINKTHSYNQIFEENVVFPLTEKG
jgi:hypothetical protein